jgi:hypothetical protein
MTIWPKSLQAQLVLRLAVVVVIAMTIGVSGIFYEGVQTADALRRDELLQRAGRRAQLLPPVPVPVGPGQAERERAQELARLGLCCEVPSRQLRSCDASRESTG